MNESPTLNAIARIKLRELERQRDALLAAYDEVERTAKSAGSPRAELRALSEGLRGVRVAGEPMHPDVVNLEGLLGVGTEPALERAVKRLRADLARGRFRSRAAFAFGALLTEWVNRPRAPDPAAEMTGSLLDRAAPKVDHAFFDAILAKLELGPVRKDVSNVSLAGGVGSFLDCAEIADDREKPAAVRAEARLFADSGDPSGAQAQRMKELRDAIAILWADMPAWRWPERVAMRSVWTGDRYRLHPDLDLLTTVLLNDVSSHLAPLSKHLISGRANRLSRLARLRELSAPEIIVSNELEMLNKTPHGLLPDPTLMDDAVNARSVAVIRAAYASELAGSGLTMTGGYGYGGNALARLAQLVYAEVEVLRGIEPKAPVYLLKTDFRDYFPSISHELLLRLVRELGLGPSWIAFVTRYLALPIAHRGETRTPACGLPLGLPLSRLLSECLLAILDAHVRLAVRPNQVRVIRLVDDVVLVSSSAAAIEKGWTAIQAFARAAGLEVNAKKSGAVAIGGRLPPGLPKALPRLGGLELTPSGRLVPSREAMGEAQARIKARIGAVSGILEKVLVYNDEVRAYVHALCPSAPFGAMHYRTVKRCVREFDEALGVRQELKRELSRRYFGGRRDLPDAWLHWPRSAGGLGLFDPLVELLPYRKRKRAPKIPGSVAPGAETRDPKWGDVYTKLLDMVSPTPPAAHAPTDMLARDFTNRLSEMKGTAEADATVAAGDVKLAPYWRWVLATHGPDVLEYFGTYRFLLTALVPLHLVQGGASRDQ